MPRSDRTGRACRAGRRRHRCCVAPRSSRGSSARSCAQRARPHRSGSAVFGASGGYPPPASRMRRGSLKDAAHERGVAAVPARAGAFALVAVRSDQDLDAVADEAFNLLLMPVAGVRESNLRLLLDSCGFEFFAGGGDVGSRCPKSAAVVLISAAITIWRSVTTPPSTRGLQDS